MLSPTDIHYLLGFLTMMSSPEDVEIVLGDLVYDVAAEEERDVDVTVTYKDSKGLLSAFKGIEVKKHGRPLDVTNVEQLAAKLRDMPEISYRAIVSASGYTKPAMRKASKHGIDLFTLADWANTMEGFDHVKFSPEMTIQQHLFTWASKPHIEFIFNPEVSAETRAQIEMDTPVLDHSGSVHPQCKTLHDLCRNILDQAIALVRDTESIEMLPNTPTSARLQINSTEEIFVRVGNEPIQISGAIVTAAVVRYEESLTTSSKVLTKVGELTPYAGCVITELSNGTLIAFGVGQVDRSVKLYPIPISNRNREKIRNLKLK